ncbi:dicarboxylate/amino acid:cation (Na+ or H+) symporter, DAACS family [Sphingomonas sp. OV641]|uniref:dicarboxylate/amino acid:cation symporter n=1 Tax=Sphingomonas sp. OV641 TaxID=1881068 RepID=UPI0008D6134A|nr:dicarboxylate/amino acid:cation symporter [Sphingomonas sp. OV641]SEJ78909.1 dicarboxylate/amino acid:cation (Na+ or H+) symporter, DAACS family [Sphingomonas sp. OV641]
MNDTAPARFPLHLQMLAGFVIGLIGGLLVKFTAGDAGWVQDVTTYVTGPIGQIFLRLLFMLVIPLLFAALVTGVAEMGDIAALRRVGVRTLIFTVLLSGLSVAIGLVLVNLLRPGAGVDPAMARELLAQAGQGAASIVQKSREAPGALDSALGIIPANVIRAAADDDILAVMFFALAFGVGIVLTGSEKTATLQSAIEGVLEVAMTLIGYVIRLAPIAVACFMFNLAALFGADILVRLGAYMATVLGALLIQLLIVYSLGVWLAAGMSPLAFFRGSQEAMVMAFSTASSNATLPTSLRIAESELKLPRKVARFVLTIGATANQNGTAIFEGVTVIFLAQFFGVELSILQQLTVMLVCILGGIGTAGVPAGSLPVVAIILGMVGVPPTAIGLVLGVDRLLDMCRTALNVTGDLAIASMVAGKDRAG